MMPDAPMRWPGVSYYATDLGDDRIQCPTATANAHYQVVIVGGGLAGLSCALSLTERGFTDIALCEAGQPGDGASGRNGGFVFAGYSLPNQALTRQAGPKQGRALHQWTQQAVRLVRQRIDRLDIDCHVNDAGVLLTDWFHDDPTLMRFAKAMRDEVGFDLDWVDSQTLSELIKTTRYGAALYEPGSFHFQPLRYVNGIVAELLARGVNIYGNTPVDCTRPIARSNSSGRWQIQSGDVCLSAEHLIITTGGYDTRLWPRLGRAIQPIATYIATTEPLGEQINQLIAKGHAIYDTRFAFDYYRPLPDTRLLWGGRISIQQRSPQAIRSVLRQDLAKVFPDFAAVKFDHAWGGWMGYTRHQMPILSELQPGLWSATGFGGHGMAPTTLAGEVIAEALSGERGRLNAFARWQPVWAGGLLGRGWAQATYAWLNFKDRWRERLGSRRISHS